MAHPAAAPAGTGPHRLHVRAASLAVAVAVVAAAVASTAAVLPAPVVVAVVTVAAVAVAVAAALLVFEPDGRVTRHEGNYSLYLELSAQQKAQEAELSAGTAAKAKLERASKASEAGSGAGGGAKKKGLSYAQQRELEAIVGRIEKAEAEVELLTARLASPAVYAEGHAAVAAVNDALREARALAQSLTARWEELEARKDA